MRENTLMLVMSVSVLAGVLLAFSSLAQADSDTASRGVNRTNTHQSQMRPIHDLKELEPIRREMIRQMKKHRPNGQTPKTWSETIDKWFKTPHQKWGWHLG